MEDDMNLGDFIRRGRPENEEPANLKRTEQFVSVLRDLEHAPHVDAAGFIRFEARGIKFLLFPYEDDPHFFQVLALFKLGEKKSKRVSRAVNAVNRTIKTVKVWRDGKRRITISVEAFVDDARSIAPLIERSVIAIEAAVGPFGLALAM